MGPLRQGIACILMTTLMEFTCASSLSDPKTLRRMASIRNWTRKPATSMDNYTVLVLLENMSPYVVMTLGPDDELSGYMGAMWQLLQEALHFRSVLVRTSFRRSQDILRNGSGDVHLQPTVITTEDIDDLDFTTVVASSWYELYVKAPEPEPRWSSYLSAWNTPLWLAFIGVLTLLTVSLWLVLALEPPIRRATISRRRMVTRRGSTSFGICVLSVLGSLGSAGMQVAVNSTAARLLVTVILIFCMVMCNSYSAVLTSRLAVVTTQLPFASLEDVARKDTHALCVRKMNYAYVQFKVDKKSESSPELEPQWRRVVDRPPCSDIARAEDLLSVMCRDSVAVLETPAIMARLLDRAPPCRMAQVRGRYAKANVALQVRKRFPYTKLINNRIHRMQEAGLLHYLRTRWITRELPVSHPPQEKGVSFRRVQFILKFYVGCMMTSLGILIAEMLYQRVPCRGV